MPTYTMTPRFERDHKKLTAQQRKRFETVVREHFGPDCDARSFRPGLRVKRVVSTTGVWEMSWAPDGRATFQYGPERRNGVPHVIWRRVGTHKIFQRGQV